MPEFDSPQDVLEWQGLVRKPKKPFSFSDARIFWDYIRGLLGRRVLRDGVAQFSSVTIEVAPGYGLEIKAPSPRTRLLTSLVQLEFDEVEGWEEEISEEAENAKYARPRKPKTEEVLAAETDDLPDEEAPSLEAAGQESEDGGYDVEADGGEYVESFGFGGGVRRQKLGGEDVDYQEEGGYFEEEPPLEAGDRAASLMAYLDGIAELEGLPGEIRECIAAYYKLMGEAALTQIERSEFRVIEETPFDLGGNSCLLLPLFSVKENLREYLAFVGTLNTRQVANKKTSFGKNQNRAEAVLLTKVDEDKPSYAVLYNESFIPVVTVIRF